MAARIPTLSIVVTMPFHGATLLALLLNNHSQISALGDTNPSREFDQGCPCGEHVSTCEFWKAIAARTDADRFSGLDSLLPLLPWPLQRYRVEGRGMPISPSSVLNRAAGRGAAAVLDHVLPLVWRHGSRPVSRYVETWRSFYDAVTELHGTTLVVDGTKSSRKAELLARELAGELDVRVLHLVRDPRGFVGSWSHHHELGDPRALAWWWRDVHERASRLERVAPYKLVRYRDLASDPETVMREIFEFLGVEPEPVVAPPRFPNKHHLIGNQMLSSWSGEVALDERWRSELAPDVQRRVLEAANGSAERFGYE